jgi:signal transduction histidine kinase
MKLYLNLSFLLLFLVGKAQTLPTNNTIQDYKRCKSTECRIKYSFLVAEYNLEIDDIQSSQKWLDIAKNLNTSKKVDTTDVFIHSLQSELFYYNGLFQFGINEAEKAIANSITLEDSLLISNGYFFKGINLFELGKFNEAEKMLWKSRNFQPKMFEKNYLRSTILNEHVYNNLAQAKLKLNQSDSAIWYNSKAYVFAQKSKSKRGIPNIEQTYGQIYLKQNKIEEAIYYLKKSNESAKKNNYNDIVLTNYALLLHCYPKDSLEINNWFQKGIELIADKKINISYQVIFFKTAIKALKKNNELKKLIVAQEALVSINATIALNNNDYIQNITKQYVENENKLLKQELNLIKSTKEKQIFYFLVAILILLPIGTWYFFKQRQELKNQEIATLKQNQEITNLEALIDGEETERKRIAQELHDGLNGDLSAIKYRLSAFNDQLLNQEDRENLSKSIDMIDNACAQVRGISHNLIPTSILDFGLVETVQQYCSKINNTHHLTLDFQYFGNPAVLPKKIETVIYRIIQELINNISKHSKAKTALVQFNFHENELFITVEDNGIGFDQTKVQKGLGLKNIASRVQFLNAQLEISSGPNGTSFHITVNLNTLKND